MVTTRFDWTATIASAGIAVAATTAALMMLGKRESGSAAAPINAVSHIAWGDEAAQRDNVDVRHTLVGGLLHIAATLGWSLMQEWVLGKWTRAGSPTRALLSGGATSAVAYVTDYHLVPKRLTPGFEKRLSPASLGLIYVILAVSLSAGSAIAQTREN